MATISKPLTSTSTNASLRAFDPRRDIGAVADLVELCFADTLDEGGRNYVQRMRSLAQEPGIFSWAANAMDWNSVPTSGYVWQQDGRLVGNATLIPFFLKWQRLFLIANVAVHPDYRRRGIARNLTLQAIEHAHQRSAPSIWLHVREENVAAVELYRSLGFVERARRTTWFSASKYSEADRLPGVTFTSPRSRDWEVQRAWLQRAYPPEVTWHMPFRIDNLHPGLWGALSRAISNAYIVQWAAWRKDRLLGAIAWQAIGGAANYLWLAVPSDVDESVVHALLAYAQRYAPSQRPLAVDYPSRWAPRAFQDAGFTAQQTLVWMELPLENHRSLAQSLD
jgi:GNAT superfamily N-acetyltransferase